MPTHPSVHVAGMAWHTPLGCDLSGVFERLLAGESGLAHVPYEGKLRNTLAARAEEYSDLPPAPRLRAMAQSAIRMALEDADREPTDPSVRLVIGTSLGDWLDD